MAFPALSPRRLTGEERFITANVSLRRMPGRDQIQMGIGNVSRENRRERYHLLANVGIIAAGLVTAFLWQSAWPDLIVGLAVAAMNADAAWEVWEAAREEHQAHA